MSDKFEKAANNVLASYKYKRRSDSNEVRSMWAIDGRYAKEEGEQEKSKFEPSSYKDLLEKIDIKDNDATAFNLYQKTKQTSEPSPKNIEVKNARHRLNFLSAVHQTIHRQYLGAQTNPGDRLNSQRYERERKVIAFGLLNKMKSEIKETEEA